MPMPDVLGKFASDDAPDDSGVAQADAYLNLLIIVLVVVVQMATQSALSSMLIDVADEAPAPTETLMIEVAGTPGAFTYTDPATGAPVQDLSAFFQASAPLPVVVVVPSAFPSSHLHAAMTEVSHHTTNRTGFDFKE